MYITQFREAQMTQTGFFVLFKRLECSQCGASVAQLVMTCDDAVRYWNDVNEQGNRPVLERIGVEPCMDVEEALKDGKE